MSFEQPDIESIQKQQEILDEVHSEDAKDSKNFIEYFDHALSLEDRAEEAFDELNIAPDQREKITEFLQLLKDKHLETYEHSLRVGLVARGIAHYQKLDEKALLYAGLLHDVGKSTTPLSTLAKTEGWTDKDTNEIEKHVDAGHEILQDTFSFSADVIAQHHQFQAKPYPKEPLEPAQKWSEKTKTLILQYGRLLALADVYDALHRINDKSGTKTALTGEQIKAQMFKHNPDQKELIEKLYNDGVLTIRIIEKEQK